MNNIKIVDLLASLAGHIPQNRADILALWDKLWKLLIQFNGWLAATIGIDFQGIANNFIVFFTKYFALSFNFILEIIKKLINRA